MQRETKPSPGFRPERGDSTGRSREQPDDETVRGEQPVEAVDVDQPDTPAWRRSGD